MIRTTITIQGNRIHVDKQLQQRALNRIVKRACELWIDVAKKDFQKKRVNKNSSGDLLDSFFYDSGVKTGDSATGIIIVGVPYGTFVDFGFTTRAGNWWEGHHFTDEAEKEVRKQLTSISREEMQKSMRYVRYPKTVIKI